MVTVWPYDSMTVIPYDHIELYDRLIVWTNKRFPFDNMTAWPDGQMTILLCHLMTVGKYDRMSVWPYNHMNKNKRPSKTELMTINIFRCWFFLYSWNL